MTITDCFGRELTIVGCANGKGGRQLGCEHAATVIKESEFLRLSPLNVNWKHTVHETSSARHLDALPGVFKVCNELCHTSAAIVDRGHDLAVIGGDHSCAMGTWSGVAKAFREKGDIGLIWVDAHLDAHRPDTSDTGNIHGMPVAHLLGYGERFLNEIGDRRPKIKPSNLIFIGIRSFEAPEQELLENLGVRIVYIEEVEKRGMTDVLEEAIEHVSRNMVGYGLSIDIDGFRVEDAPAVGTPVDGGIVASDFMEAVQNADLSNLLATEIVEFLPKFDDANKTSERLVVDLLSTIYSTKFAQLEEDA